MPIHHHVILPCSCLCTTSSINIWIHIVPDELLLHKVERRFISNNQEESIIGNIQGEQSDDVNINPSSNPEGRDSTKDKYKRGHIVISYRTIILVKPKDKDTSDRKSGTIYWYQCGELVCDELYIGDTFRTLGRDIKSIIKNPHPSMDTVTFQDITPTLITSSPQGGSTMA